MRREDDLEVADFKEAPRLPTLKELVGFPTNERTKASFRSNLVSEDGEDSKKSGERLENLEELDEEEAGLNSTLNGSSESSKETSKNVAGKKGETLEELNEAETGLNFKLNKFDGSLKHFVDKDESGGKDLLPRKSGGHDGRRVRINDIDDERLRRRKSRVNYARSLDTDVTPTTMRGVPLEVLTARTVLRGFYVTKGGIERVEATTGVSPEDTNAITEFSTTDSDSFETSTEGMITSAETATESPIMKDLHTNDDFHFTTEVVGTNFDGTPSAITEDVALIISTTESSTVGAPINESLNYEANDTKETTVAYFSETVEESQDDSHERGSSVIASVTTTTIPKTTMPLAETTDELPNLQRTDSLEASSALPYEESASYTETVMQSTTPATAESSVQSTLSSRGRNRGRIRSRTRSTTSSYFDSQSIEQKSTPISRTRGRNHRRTTTSSPIEAVEVVNYSPMIQWEHSRNSTTEMNKMTVMEESDTTEFVPPKDVSSIFTTSIPGSLLKTTSDTQKVTVSLYDDSTTMTDVTDAANIVSTIYPESVDSFENHASAEIEPDVTTLGTRNIPKETISVIIETTPVTVTLEEEAKPVMFNISDGNIQSSTRTANNAEMTTHQIVLPQTTEAVFQKETIPETVKSELKEVALQSTELSIEETKIPETTERLISETASDARLNSQTSESSTEEKIVSSESAEATTPSETITEPTEATTPKELITEPTERTTQEIITVPTPTEPTTTPKKVSSLNPSRLRQTRRRQKIRLNQARHDFGRHPSRRTDIQRRVTHRKYAGQFDIRRRGNTVFRGRRPNVSSSTTPEPRDETIDSTDSERGKAEETVREDTVKRVKTRNDEEESAEGKDQEEQETTLFPASVERAVDEVNLSKSTGLPTRKPGSLLANRLRKPTTGTLTTSKLPSTVAGHRKTRPNETTLPTTNVEDDPLNNQTESPQPGKDVDEKAEVDQSSRAQELAVTLADPPSSSSSSSQGSSDTGRGSLIKESLRRRISTTIAPRTTTVRPVRSRQKPRKDRIVESSTARPRRPQVIDYDYYEDEEVPIVGKSTFNGKLFLTSKGTLRCLDQGNFPHPFSCKKFITCARMVNGQVIGAEYTCPDKLSFDPVGGICNWSAGLGCKE